MNQVSMADSAKHALQNLQKMLVEEGNPEALIVAASQFIAENPGSSEAHFLLACGERRAGRIDQATSHVNQALLTQPFHPAYHTLLGELYLDKNQRQAAKEAFANAVKAKPDFVPALAALALAHMEDGEPKVALKHLESCVILRPNEAAYLNNLGACHLALNRPDQAAAVLAKALNLNPKHASSRFNLGRAQIMLGQDDHAYINLKQVTETENGNAEAHFLLGSLCHRQGRLDEAFRYLSTSTRLDPQNVLALNALAEFSWEQGDTETAKALYQHAATFSPEYLKSRIAARLSLPLVYASTDQVKQSRAEYLSGLSQLKEQVAAYSTLPPHLIERELQWSNFLLAYQGENDKEPQKDYADFCATILKQAAPDCFEPLNKRPDGKIRIGFVGHHFYDCTVGRYFSSWIHQLNSSEYESVVFHVNTKQDQVTARLARAAHSFQSLGHLSLYSIAREIRRAQLDVVIFPELGMHPLTYPLAAFRLAPVQLVAWGHPVTTGHANIDGYLSCATMEPTTGADHYSEALHLLPGLGTYYEEPLSEISVSRGAFRLPENRNLYLIPQSLFKIHPDNDEVYSSILQRDPLATLVFFSSERHKTATNIFVRRLESVLKQNGVAHADAVRIHPQVSHPQYLRVNQLCDVMVDTLKWSGGNTAIDAISSGLPIVTCPGEQMRGRQSMAMLKQLGAEDLIVQNSEMLAATAVQIATDKERLTHWRQSLLGKKEALFRQLEPIRTLENHLRKLVH